MTAKIKLNAASGGGSFSLQAPSSSSNNRVFQLPDSADGTLARTSDIDVVKLANVNSGSTILNFGLESIDTSIYRMVRLVGGFLTGTDGAIPLFYYKNGSTTLNGSDYHYAASEHQTGSSSNSTYHGSGAVGIELTKESGNGNTEGLRLDVSINFAKSGTDAASAAINNFITFQAMRFNSSGVFRSHNGGGVFKGQQNTDGFMIQPNTGQIHEYSYATYGYKS